MGDAGAKLHDGSSRYGHGGASFDVTVESQPDGGDCLSFGDAFPYFAACDVDFCFEVFAVFYKFFIECVGDGESFFCLFEVFRFVVFAVFVDFLDAVNVEFTVRVVFFKAVPADLCDSHGEFLHGESGDGFCCFSFNATVQFEPDGGQMFCPATGEVFPDLVGCDGLTNRIFVDVGYSHTFVLACIVSRHVKFFYGVFVSITVVIRHWEILPDVFIGA